MHGDHCFARSLVGLFLTLSFLVQAISPVIACGPETIEPIFVFTGFPDLPFEEFTKGKIGILQSTFGRKTLVIAHRYLSGGTFTENEQRGLVEALKGKAPEDSDDSAIKAWITARKEVLGDEKEQLAIYDERRHEGYDFFPNCTRNAFEVATQTLKERVASYGADKNVRDWLRAQDVVFQNCAEGTQAPTTASAGPRWLQKDRDYQIAAAYFYSLNFPEARARFERIANDSESVWQETAGYLVGRTLVREASLNENENEKHALYERAEAYLINLVASGTSFRNAAKRLLSLVTFRLRPEERIRELAQVLDEQSGNENVRQDLIDYTWLLDKFDAQIQKAEEERKKRLNPTASPSSGFQEDPEYKARYEAVQRGEMIELYFFPKREDGKPDYPKSVDLYLKSDATEAEVFQRVEIELGRKLSPEESQDLKEHYAGALSHRQWLLSPNRKINTGREYDGCDGNCNDLTLAMLPEFLRADDLSDWIMTFQSHDPKAYGHSVSKWRQTHSTSWLAVALTKSTKTSRGIIRLMREAERIEDDSPAYPTIAYELVRLRFDLNRPVDAQKLLDNIIATQFESLPVSSQNLFLEQRMKAASSVDEFLKFAMRKPVAFTEYGTIGRITDLMKTQKGLWDAEYYKETKEEYEKKTEETFKQFLPWDERKAFDPDSADQFNWHFSLAALLQASRSALLPDYLRRSVALSVWTRAVLLKNDLVAREVSEDLARLAPEMSALLASYLRAETREQRDNEALYILLKFSSLSPYVPSGIPQLSTSEESEYYFETSWWCKPDDIEYDMDGKESPKIVASPRFLGAQILNAAKKERAALVTIGSAKSFLGKKVLDWARRSPNDSRIPEAMYIAIQANQSYKYGCGSWEQDEETRTLLEKLLREKYPNSPWIAKLVEESDH
jgi:hypothetical protein